VDVPAQTLLFKEPQVSHKSQAGFEAVGLFAGIGGIELGLRRAGWHTDLLCEIDPYAREVLSRRFDVPVDEIVGDVRKLRGLPKVTLLAGGFPCQDLSQAGRTAGIRGAKSGLVGEVFRLLEECTPRWLLLENVPFMLRLDGGKAMAFLAASLESLGYTWAYRVVDTRSFGLPHRRKRVIMVASRSEDPRGGRGGAKGEELGGSSQRLLLDGGPPRSWLGNRLRSHSEVRLHAEHSLASGYLAARGVGNSRLRHTDDRGR